MADTKDRPATLPADASDAERMAKFKSDLQERMKELKNRKPSQKLDHYLQLITKAIANGPENTSQEDLDEISQADNEYGESVVASKNVIADAMTNHYKRKTE